MTDTIEFAIKQEFLLEAQELLQGCEAYFLELEQNPGDKSILDSIFRLAHTVKGSGLAAGFDHLAGFAHKFETLLDALRCNKVALSAEVVDLLLQSNDFLVSYTNALRADYSATLEYDDLAAQIAKIMDGVATESSKTRIKETPTTSAIKPAPALSKVAQRKSVTNPPQFTDLKVLVVDDDLEHLDLIEYALEDLNLEVLKASSGQEALEVFDKTQPHLIISDLKMPDLDGIQFATELRKRGIHTPIIFCSGFAGRSDLAEFIRIGAVGFVEKPYDPDHLKMLVEQALHTRITRESVIKLARLAYRSYRISSKLVSKLGQDQMSAHLDVMRELESTLDEISEYSRLMVNSGEVLTRNEKKKKGAA